MLNVLTFNGQQVQPASNLAHQQLGNRAAGRVAVAADGRYTITIETRVPRLTSGQDVTLAGLPNGRTTHSSGPH
ncbi:MAG: hypothetical protein WKG07_11095 [Hymenobacter sp.]